VGKILTQAWFVIFPVLIGTKKWKPAQQLLYVRPYLFGLLVAVLICYVSGLVQFMTLGSWHVLDDFGRSQHILFYNKFSEILDLHPTYFSIYLGLGCMVLLSTTSKNLGINAWIKYALLLIFLITNVLTGSKAGILSFVVASIICMSYKYVVYKWKKDLVLVALIVLIFAFFFSFSSALTSRFNQAFRQVTLELDNSQNISESTGIRVALWKLSVKVSQGAIFLGHGTGSVIKTLNDHCLENFSFSICEDLRNKNSHNQFLNFLVSNGLIAVFVFTGALVLSFMRAIKNRDIIFMFFMIFMTSNFLFESILQRERGIVFFMLFLSTFSITAWPSKNHERGNE
jgi:hypothetical protein